MTKSIQWKTVYLGIGTNKGNREVNISNAIKLLSEVKETKILKVSKLLKNPPQEGIKNGYFLNGAIKLLTSLTPLELLKVCKKIEEKLGRRCDSSLVNRSSSVTTHDTRYTIHDTRNTIHKSRVIDLDILFYGDEIIDTKELTVPHIMIEKRYFVLIPLMEIAEKFVHPALKKSVEQLYKDYLAPTSIKNCARAV